MEPLYIVVNIGCIECGVSSDIVGVYENKEEADQICSKCHELYSWRQNGQNDFDVFNITELNVINPEYKNAIVTNN